MDRYIGLDDHLQSCTLAVLGPSGKRLQSLVIETNGRALVQAILNIPGRKHVCLEEGARSAWLYEIIRPHVAEVVVTCPGRRAGRKNDLGDAWARAEDIRTGSLQTVIYKARQGFSGLRQAVQGYRALTRDTVRTKNRLRALYRSRGIRVDSKIYRAEHRSLWESQLPASLRRLAQLWGGYLEGVEQTRAEAESWLREEAKKHGAVRLVGTAPGMGVIRSAQVVAIVMTPTRFRTTRQFWSYCGLGIDTQSTGDWIRQDGQWVRAQTRQTRGLNRNRQPTLKEVFKGAAMSVSGYMIDHPLHQDYQRTLESGIKPTLARLTLARRIAAAVLSMWKHQEEYDPKKHCRKNTEA